MPMYGAFVDTGVKGTGIKPKSPNAQPLKMKKVLNSKYANDIFKFKNVQFYVKIHLKMYKMHQKNLKNRKQL